MATVQHQREGHMSGWYYFGRRILAFFSYIFCSISGEAMLLWKIEHRVFAYDSYVKNNEYVTAVGREFLASIQYSSKSVFSPIRQSYVGWLHFTRKVYSWIGDWSGPHDKYIHWKMWNVSDKLCCGIPINLLRGIPLNLASAIDQ